LNFSVPVVGGFPNMPPATELVKLPLAVSTNIAHLPPSRGTLWCDKTVLGGDGEVRKADGTQLSEVARIRWRSETETDCLVRRFRNSQQRTMDFVGPNVCRSSMSEVVVDGFDIIMAPFEHRLCHGRLPSKTGQIQHFSSGVLSGRG
jgi:hypothetical protein